VSLQASQDAQARFDQALRQVVDELREQLLADVVARSTGAPMAGGARWAWRQHVEYLASIRTAPPAREPQLLVVR
jgi:hypothetical protein